MHIQLIQESLLLRWGKSLARDQWPLCLLVNTMLVCSSSSISSRHNIHILIHQRFSISSLCILSRGSFFKQVKAICMVGPVNIVWNEDEPTDCAVIISAAHGWSAYSYTSVYCTGQSCLIMFVYVHSDCNQ